MAPRSAPDAGGIERRAEPLDAELRRELGAIAARHPGVIAEDKGYSVALHYRMAPAQGLNVVRRGHARVCKADPFDRELLTGKAVIEVKAERLQQRHRGARADDPSAVRAAASRSSSATT